MTSKDVIQRKYLLAHWERMLTRNDVSPTIKTFVRKEIAWLKRQRSRAAQPGGLGK